MTHRRWRSGRLARSYRASGFVVRIAASAIAVVIVLETLGFATWWFFGDWRQGRVVLTNDGPPLRVQVLGESGDEPIAEPVDLIARSTLALPAGDYRLRVAGDGQLSRTFRIAVNPGETTAHALNLDQGRLLAEDPVQEFGFGNSDPPKSQPIPYSRRLRAIELAPGNADLIDWNDRSLIRRDAATGELVWDALRMPGLHEPRRELHPWLLWFAAPNRGLNATLVEPTLDLSGDGTRDLLWKLSGATFLALSGKDGSVLWTYVAELDGPGGAYPEGPEWPGPLRPALRPGQVYGVAPAADFDRDGVPNLIASIVFHEFPAEVRRRLPNTSLRALRNTPSLSRRVVMAVSGRSGKWLWSHAIDPAFTMIQQQYWDRPAIVVSGRKTSIVAMSNGTAWLGLDPQTGRPRSGPIDLGFEPLRPVQYADLDGDGEPDILALGPGTGARDQTLAAFSIATGRPLWSATINVEFSRNTLIPTAWPLVVELDGDGKAEIVVPDAGALDAANGYRGIRMLDGSTGRPRWTRPMRPETKANDGLAGIIAAPDLDHDGVRDLVTTSRFAGRQPTSPTQGHPGEPHRIYVDALSGKDGRRLWWWHVEYPSDDFTYVASPQWWGRGPDGWPLLAVLMGGGASEDFGRRPPRSALQPPMAHMLEASTGREMQTLSGFSEIHVADLDGDGLSDLWGDFEGDLRAFRGEAPEAWRAIGAFVPARDPASTIWGFFQPAADFDGDGIADTLIAALTAPGDSPSTATGSRTAVARSGRDGRLLWKTELDARRAWFDRDRGESYRLTSYPLPDSDLDGDGTPDVIVQELANQPPTQALKHPATLPLMVLSGRTGQPLWIAGPLPLDFEARGYSQVQWVEPRAVEPNAPPDLLVRHDSPFLAASPTPPAPNAPAQDRLARISGRTGRIVWDVPLAEPVPGPRFGYNAPPTFHDVDGDGLAELVVLAAGPPGRSGQPGTELKVISPRDGRLLWSQALDSQTRTFHNIGTINLDEGKRRALVVEHDVYTGMSFSSVARAFDGRDGNELWTWSSGPGYVGSRPGVTMEPARLEGATRNHLCLHFRASNGKLRVVVLDAHGKEIARRDNPPIEDPGRAHMGLMRVVDLDGDDRDELLVWHSDRLRGWGRGFKELWSWPDQTGGLEQVLPSTAGRPATILLNSGVGLDGMTGVPRWTAQLEAPWPSSRLAVLDPGSSDRLPLLVSLAQGATICRAALPASASGAFAPPRGTAVPPGLARDDPRWTRPLPWTMLVLHRVFTTGLLSACGLALVNAVLPLGLLWLAARRRPWTLRLLMALPIAVAVPLWVFQSIEPMIPVQLGSTPMSARVVFVLGTLAGLPIVLYAGFAAWNLLRGRWKAVATLVGLTIVASAMIAGAWLWIDLRNMPAIEHYDRSNGFLAAMPGAYAVGVLLLIAWPLRRILRRIK